RREDRPAWSGVAASPSRMDRGHGRLGGGWHAEEAGRVPHQALMLYRFENIEKSYGPHDVLRGVTWQHNPGEKVGLVGRNGAGKTTLFKLLLREEDPDRGEIIRASALTVGHLRQHLDAERG